MSENLHAHLARACFGREPAFERDRESVPARARILLCLPKDAEIACEAPASGSGIYGGSFVTMSFAIIRHDARAGRSARLERARAG
jgi:hypothetical protein